MGWLNWIKVYTIIIKSYEYSMLEIISVARKTTKFWIIVKVGYPWHGYTDYTWLFFQLKHGYFFCDIIPVLTPWIPEFYFWPMFDLKNLLRISDFYYYPKFWLKLHTITIRFNLFQFLDQTITFEWSVSEEIIVKTINLIKLWVF